MLDLGDGRLGVAGDRDHRARGEPFSALESLGHPVGSPAPACSRSTAALNVAGDDRTVVSLPIEPAPNTSVHQFLEWFVHCCRSSLELMA